MHRPNSLKEAVERALAGAPLHATVGELLDEFYTRPGDRQEMIDEAHR